MPIFVDCTPTSLHLKMNDGHTRSCISLSVFEAMTNLGRDERIQQIRDIYTKISSLTKDYSGSLICYFAGLTTTKQHQNKWNASVCEDVSTVKVVPDVASARTQSASEEKETSTQL